MYSDLVIKVKEAFEACELVRINCKDMNKSDVRKIGAKLKVCKTFMEYLLYFFSVSLG